MSTATRTTRLRKMTKEDNSDIAAADAATAEETAKVPNETVNDDMVASAAGETIVSVVVASNIVDGIDTSKDAEIAKAQETSATAGSVTVNAGEVSLKPVASTTEANSTNTANETAAGEIELTANFPQKV
jgi:hypothetical protein